MSAGPRAPGHRTTIGTEWGHVGGVLYFAYCACGWESEAACRSFDRAFELAEAHIANAIVGTGGPS